MIYGKVRRKGKHHIMVHPRKSFWDQRGQTFCKIYVDATHTGPRGHRILKKDYPIHEDLVCWNCRIAKDKHNEAKARKASPNKRSALKRPERPDPLKTIFRRVIL